MKKISVDSYADALLAVSKETKNAGKLIEKFIEAIKKNNDWARRTQILEACEKKWRHLHGKSLITIESARPLSSEQQSKLTNQWKNKNSDIEYKINNSLIAGVKVIINEEKQFDVSLKRKLATLFS